MLKLVNSFTNTFKSNQNWSLNLELSLKILKSGYHRMNTSDGMKKKKNTGIKIKFLPHPNTINLIYIGCLIKTKTVSSMIRPSKHLSWWRRVEDVLETSLVQHFFVFQVTFKASWRMKSYYAKDVFKANVLENKKCLLGKFWITAKLTKICNNMLKLNHQWQQ